MAQTFYTMKNQVPLAGGATLGFETGKGYYAKPSAGGGGGGGGGAGGGFGLNPSDKTLAKYLASLFGAPETPQQAQGDVQAQVNPILAQLSADAQARMKAGGEAISGLTDTYSKRLAALEPQVHANDQAAQESEQTAGGALRDYLASEGNTLAGGVEGAGAAAPAGSAMANAAAAAGAGVAGLGAGTAGEAAGRTYTGLSDLIASGQHAEDYAGQLPGLAALSGEQGIGTLASNVEGDFQNKSNSLTAQIPGMVEQIMQNAQTTKGQKAQLIEQFLSGALDRNAQKAITDETLNKDYTTAALNASTRKYVTDVGASTKTGLANTKAAQPDPSLSKVYGYVVDAHGNIIPGADGKKQLVAGKPPKALTPDDQRRITSIAANIATVAYNGGKAKDGSVLKPLSYNDALTEMRNEGLLTNPASAALAIAVLKRIYKVNSPASDQIDAMTAHGLSPSGGPPLSPKAKKAIDNALPLPFGG